MAEPALEDTTHLRRCTAADIPWLIATAKWRYGERFKSLDGARQWIPIALRNPDVFLARGEHVFVVAVLQRTFYDPTPDAYVPLIAGETTQPWEAMMLLQAAREWARLKGARDFWLRFTNGQDAGPFAKRLGMTETHPTYVQRIN